MKRGDSMITIREAKLADNTYKRLIKTGTPLEMIYEDLLGIVTVLAELAYDD